MPPQGRQAAQHLSVDYVSSTGGFGRGPVAGSTGSSAANPDVTACLMNSSKALRVVLIDNALHRSIQQELLTQTELSNGGDKPRLANHQGLPELCICSLVEVHLI